MTPQDQAHVAKDQVTGDVRAQTCASLLAKPKTIRRHVKSSYFCMSIRSLLLYYIVDKWYIKQLILKTDQTALKYIPHFNDQLLKKILFPLMYTIFVACAKTLRCWFFIFFDAKKAFVHRWHLRDYLVSFLKQKIETMNRWTSLSFYLKCSL